MAFDASDGAAADRSDSPDGAPVNPPPPKSSRSGTVAFGAIVLAILAKGKGLLIGLKFLKFSKLLLTFGSMFATMAFYAMSSGWRFAVGFVLMILVHELGHGIAIKRAGLAAGYPVFIPFFGAMIALKGQPRNPLVEAEIAIAGPVAGAGAALVCAALYFWSRDPLYLVLANAGFYLNLFNLTPLPPLDGGRVAMLFSRRAWIVGAIVMGALFLFTATPQLILIGIMSLGHLFGRNRAPAFAPDAAAEVTVAERQNMALLYFGLCFFLGAGSYFAQQLLPARPH